MAHPTPRTFREYLETCARVPMRDASHGSYGPFTFAGRAPLDFIVTLIDKVLANTLHGETVEIDGIAFKGAEGALGAGPACLKGATISVGGGAQFGKTVLILNFQAYATFVEFVNFGYYTPDQELLAKIVDTKFRPDVIDQQPWMAQMVQLGKSENASGRATNRKHSYQVVSTTANGKNRKAFGHFCGMQKPPTTISLDAAALDEVDDIPARNLGYVDGRMTGSRLQLKFEIGTQRISGAGQNARLKAGSFHVMMYECTGCGLSWNLEEEFPRCVRVRTEKRKGVENAKTQNGQAGTDTDEQWTNSQETLDPGRINAEIQTPLDSRLVRSLAPPFPESRPPEGGTPNIPDPILTPESGHDRNAHYYCACPSCGTELDRDAGHYVARNPHRIAEAHFSVRVSQLNISAISLQEIVSAWYTAMADPSGEALTAFYCDRIAIPNAGTAQPITPQVLEQCRTLGLSEKEEASQEYPMSFSLGNNSASSASLRFSCFAGLDTGPRCWFWCDQVVPGSNGGQSVISALIWAELIASGNAPTRVPLLMEALGITCLFIDAGGEPDLTKRLVLALNGLENYTPPNLPRTELLHTRLGNIGHGLTWDADKGQWTGLRAAAVLFVGGEARGIEQTLGFTQDGKIYPLIKCHRGESIQTAVNDFLTPAAGVLEQIGATGRSQETLRVLRTLPRARLPRTYPGAGVSQAVLDSHLLNLRKERDPRTGVEDWIDGVENHLGLAKTYARLAALVGSRPRVPLAWSKAKFHPPGIGDMGMGKFNNKFIL